MLLKFNYFPQTIFKQIYSSFYLPQSLLFATKNGNTKINNITNLNNTNSDPKKKTVKNGNGNGKNGNGNGKNGNICGKEIMWKLAKWFITPKYDLQINKLNSRAKGM